MSRHFLSLFRQYSPGEIIPLFLAHALSFILHRIPAYLLRTTTSFTRYYELGYDLKRRGGDTLMTTNEFKILLRRNSSDSMVYDQIFLHEELKPIVALIDSKNIKIEYILDCGANIGLTTLYLSKAVRPLKILALEPEPENFKRLVANVELNGLTEVVTVNKGVWSRKALLEHDESFCNAKDWAFSVRETDSGKGTIQVDTLDSIVASNEFPYADYIKMDIEGSEFELFRNPETWEMTLKQAKIISIEVHEKKGPIKEIEQRLIEANFQIFRTGELLVGYRI